MKIFAETNRLILRELLPTDDQGMFELDSDPEVHKYLYKTPVKNIEESRQVIAFVRQQYAQNGIGRWAVILKDTQEFIGWAGLKLVTESINNHQDFYDLGYRFIRKHWGKGYGSEAAFASVKFGFKEMKLNKIYAFAHAENAPSRKIIEKSGLHFVEYFEDAGDRWAWYETENRN